MNKIINFFKTHIVWTVTIAISLIMIIAISIILISGNITSKCDSHIDFNVDGFCDTCGKKTDVANNQNVYDLENAVDLFNQFNDLLTDSNGLFSMVSTPKHIGNINITSNDSSVDLSSKINKIVLNNDKLYASVTENNVTSETVILFVNNGSYTISQTDNKWAAEYSAEPLLNLCLPELPDVTISDVYFDSEQNAFVVRSHYFTNAEIDNETQKSTLTFKVNKENEIYDARYIATISTNNATLEVVNTHYENINGKLRLEITERNTMISTTQVIEYVNADVDTVSYELIISTTLGTSDEKISVKMQGEILDETSLVTITPEMQIALDEAMKLESAHITLTEKYKDQLYYLAGSAECPYLAVWEEALGVYSVFERTMVSNEYKYAYVGPTISIEDVMCVAVFNTEVFVVTKHCVHDVDTLNILTKYAGEFEYAGTDEFLTVHDTQYNVYVTLQRNEMGFYKYHSFAETQPAYKLVTVDWVGREFFDVTE